MRFDLSVAAAQTQFAGLRFSLAGEVDSHHNIAHSTWHLGHPGADPLAIGFDVAVIENGRIAKVLGSFLLVFFALNARGRCFCRLCPQAATPERPRPRCGLRVQRRVWGRGWG
ncbi:hypothetical protein [Nocardia vinacea]|uniref:hypothetical protein n=1 Tax=Nocardia vinacea TaxID=96468 RepID=UPI0012F62C37|nr:hypothetical protein [Nocardia vinacea]